MADRQGFEPWRRLSPSTHLAGGRFRPLSHLSASIIIAWGPCPNPRNRTGQYPYRCRCAPPRILVTGDRFCESDPRRQNGFNPRTTRNRKKASQQQADNGYIGAPQSGGADFFAWFNLCLLHIGSQWRPSRQNSRAGVSGAVTVASMGPPHRAPSIRSG